MCGELEILPRGLWVILVWNLRPPPPRPPPCAPCARVENFFVVFPKRDFNVSRPWVSKLLLFLKNLRKVVVIGDYDSRPEILIKIISTRYLFDLFDH
jgi:hypothetical protein